MNFLSIRFFSKIFFKNCELNVAHNTPYNKNARGVSIVEVLIASAIIMTSVVSIMGVYGGLTSIAIRNTAKVQAGMLLDEGAEALRFMRDVSWNANINPLVNGTTYTLYWDHTVANYGWRATTTRDMIDDQFDRTFILSSVYRDATSYDIVNTGGTLDAGTRKATISVFWFDGVATSTKSIIMYLYNTYNR
jgi:Tfp pilus assembly protein PilV